MTYRITVENALENLYELTPLYYQHYCEMQARLKQDGVDIPDFNPRYDEYAKAVNSGMLINMVVRTETGEAVGYCNVYVTNDMHNGEKIAEEDTIFVRKDHRNGVGKKLVQFGLELLRQRGVKRLHVQAVTDLRVAKLWQRMGFKPVATAMIFRF